MSKRNDILDYIHRTGETTKKEIVGRFDDYYCNGAKHIGDILSRMVKSGHLERVGFGVYKLNTKGKGLDCVDSRQTDLFENN